jgi:hypothetical protein
MNGRGGIAAYVGAMVIRINDGPKPATADSNEMK